MFNKLLATLSFLFVIPAYLSAQNCDRIISGRVIDLSTGKAIEYANIYSKEAEAGVVTDSLGYFKIQNLCNGSYHISASHIGCLPKHLFVQITKDTSLIIYLDHNSEVLNEVNIIGEITTAKTQESQTLTSEDIAQNSDKNLATMLEDVTGVSSIKNGSGIAKPIVHGLYGNRLTILNNGIAQSGQQWGVDHSLVYFGETGHVV